MRKPPRILTLFLIGIGSASMGATAVAPLAAAVGREKSGILGWVKNLPKPLEAAIIAPSMIGALFLSFILAVAIHESGHIVAGWLARFRFAFMLFWPVSIRRKGQRGISVRPLFRSGLGLGGIAGMIPESGIDLREGYRKLLIGGPAASLIWGVAAVGLSLAMRQSIPIPAGLFWMMGVFSLGLFIVAMIPSNAGGYLSDGAAIRMLRSGSPEQVEPYVAVMELTTEWAMGKRPAEWNRDSLARMSRVDASDPLATRVPYFSFLHAADSGDLTSAREHMDKMLLAIDKTPLLLQPDYHLKHAWLTAREGRPAEAREILARAQGGLMEKCEKAMVEAVILQAEGNLDQARQKARESLALIEESMMPEAQVFTRKQCEALLS